jgi:hypothetical protein
MARCLKHRQNFGTFTCNRPSSGTCWSRIQHVFLRNYNDDDDDHHHLDGVRTRLWTEGTNGPNVHPQVICEHREQWWNDTDRGKLLTHPQELSGIPTSSHLVAKQEELAVEIMTFPYEVVCLFHTSKGSLTYRKILRHGASGFASPLKEGVPQIFIAL